MSIKVYPRYDFPEDEKKYKWLPMLLNAYNIIDRACSVGLHEEENKRNQKLACGSGCYHCCLNPTVPITEIEFNGITWFATEKLVGDVRKAVMKHLLAHEDTQACPFLVNKICSIYPLRPIACREFHVFGEKCKADEDVFFTRRNDMWSPSRENARKVSMTILPYWGVTRKKQQLQAFEEGFIFSSARNMHEINWAEVQKLMLSYNAC